MRWVADSFSLILKKGWDRQGRRLGCSVADALHGHGCYVQLSDDGTTRATLG